MEHNNGYWLGAARESAKRTWELIDGKPLSSILVAGVIFFLGLYLWAKIKGRNHESTKDKLLDLIVGIIVVIVVGSTIFTFQLLIIQPQKEHQVVISTARSDDAITTRDKDLQNTLGKLQGEFQRANDKLDTIALATGMTSTGGLNEKLDKFLDDFQQTKDSVGNLQKFAKDPLDQAIASATATIVITVATSTPVSVGKNMGLGGGAVLQTESGSLLTASTTDNETLVAAPGQAKYRLIATCAVDDLSMGRPIRSLSEAQTMQIIFTKLLLPPKTRVLGGSVVWVINNQVTLNFKIPEQFSILAENNTEVTLLEVYDIRSGLRPLLPRP